MRIVRVTTREIGTVRGTARRPHFSLAIISVTVQLQVQVFWDRSVYFNVRNILPKSDTFPPGHPVHTHTHTHTHYPILLSNEFASHLSYELSRCTNMDLQNVT